MIDVVYTQCGTLPIWLIHGIHPVHHSLWVLIVHIYALVNPASNSSNAVGPTVGAKILIASADSHFPSCIEQRHKFPRTDGVIACRPIDMASCHWQLRDRQIVVETFMAEDWHIIELHQRDFTIDLFCWWQPSCLAHIGKSVWIYIMGNVILYYTFNCWVDINNMLPLTAEFILILNYTFTKYTIFTQYIRKVIS